MSFETVDLDITSDGVASIRLNRPERLNALNYQLVGELHDALDEVAGDESCKAVVLTGAGRGFCAGLDLRDFGTVPPIGGHPHRHAGVSGQGFLANLTVHIRNTPQIVIAAVNGPAHGGGLALAAACDIRFASDEATFSSAFIKTGLTGTDVGISYLLPRLIGASHAFDMIITGRTVDADEAQRMGLVSRVATGEELLHVARSVAGEISSFTSFGLVRTKEVLWHNLGAQSLEAAIALENRNQELAAREPEVVEYMKSYRGRITRSN